MKNKLQLFVWTDFCCDYTSGLAFAIAKEETDARKLIIDRLGFNPGDWGHLKIYSLTTRIAHGVCGGG